MERVVVTIRGTATKEFRSDSVSYTLIAKEVAEALRNHGIDVDDSNFFTLQLHQTTQL
jgi:hypothetical protein